MIVEPPERFPPLLVMSSYAARMMPVGEMAPSVQKLRSSAASTASCRFTGIWAYSRFVRSTTLNVPSWVAPSL